MRKLVSLAGKAFMTDKYLQTLIKLFRVIKYFLNAFATRIYEECLERNFLYLENMLYSFISVLRI